MNIVVSHSELGEKTKLAPFVSEQLLDRSLLKPVQFDVQSRSHAFTSAWSKGVQFVGEQWFVDDPWGGAAATGEECIPTPNVLKLNDALETMGGAQCLFFSLMVSFYSPREGSAMLKRCGFCGLADLSRLDTERRQIISDLMMHSCA